MIEALGPHQKESWTSRRERVVGWRWKLHVSAYGRNGVGFICCRRNTEFGSGDSVIEVYVPVLGLANDQTSLPHSENFSWMRRD